MLTWLEIYSYYDSIRELCEYTNKVFGSLFAMFLGVCLVAQAAGLDTVLVVPQVIAKIQLLFVMIVQISIFILAADASNQVVQNIF